MRSWNPSNCEINEKSDMKEGKYFLLSESRKRENMMKEKSGEHRVSEGNETALGSKERNRFQPLDTRGHI